MGQPGATATGRTITIVTEKPVFFFGARKPDAKSTAGYEVAVMKIELDQAGRGNGVMAAAARVKPDGAGGVIIDQYAETPAEADRGRREVARCTLPARPSTVYPPVAVADEDLLGRGSADASRPR